MIALTPQQVLFIHARLIQETGGSHGVLDIGLLESAVARPAATFGGQDLYPDLFTKAAALLESLVRNHPFVDGNKRTGITASSLYLHLNGYQLMAENDEVVLFTLSVARGEMDIRAIASGLISHTRLR